MTGRLPAYIRHSTIVLEHTGSRSHLISVARHLLYSSSCKDNGDDETVEAESFGENKDENHSDVDIFLSVGSDTCVSNNSDSKTGGER